MKTTIHIVHFTAHCILLQVMEPQAYCLGLDGRSRSGNKGKIISHPSFCNLSMRNSKNLRKNAVVWAGKNCQRVYVKEY